MTDENANRYAVSSAIGADDEGLASVLNQAAEKLANSIREPDLVMAFIAGWSAEDFDLNLASLKGNINAKTVVATNCEAAIAESLELEGEKSVVLWAAKFQPGVSVLPMRLQYERSPDGGAFTGWSDGVDGEWPEDSFLISVSEPFSFPVDVLVERMNEDRPGVQVVGGVCSGSFVPGESRLMLNDDVFESGAIVLRFSGLQHQAIVSQGCRPIGTPFVVTNSFGTEISELGGEPAFKRLHDLFQQLPTRDQRLMQNGLHLGVVMNEQQAEFEFGDFLIRNVVGVNEEDQSITVADFVRVGKTVQFHLRDEDSATNELLGLLNGIDQAAWVKSALLFSCNGRGSRLFSEPHHDATQFQKAHNGNLPLAGFFAAGEVGPVGENNYLHGFTVSGILLG